MAEHIALEWAGAEYELVKPDLADPEFLAVNPLGQVPAMQDGKGTPGMTQGTALLHYIAQKFPEKKLAGDGSIEQNYALNHALSFISTDFHLSHMPAFYPQRFTTSTNEGEIARIKEAALAKLLVVLGHFEQLLDGKEYLVGDKPSIADAYGFTVSRWYNFVSPTPMPTEKFPNIVAYQERMMNDPVVAKVLAVHNPAYMK